MKLRIRDLREDRDLTQKQVAEHLMCDQSLYSKYERGEREIPSNLLIKLAQFYNTSIDYLVGLTDNPKPYRWFLFQGTETGAAIAVLHLQFDKLLIIFRLTGLNFCISFGSGKSDFCFLLPHGQLLLTKPKYLRDLCILPFCSLSDTLENLFQYIIR